MKVLDYDGTDHLIDKIYDALNSGGSADYIVEEGTSGIWTYRKWASGIAECWGRLTSAETTATTYNFNGYLPSGIMDTTTTKYITASGGFSGVPDSHIGYCRCSPAGRYDMYIFRSATISRVAEMDVFIKGLWKEFTPSVSVGHIDLVSMESATGKTSITIPPTNEWRFALISSFVTVSGTAVTYQTVILNNQNFSSPSVLMGNGYYYGSGDYGLCNYNINMNSSGGAISLRNFIYAGTSYTTTATTYVRFYGSK